MQNSLAVKRKNYWSLDAAKFICALTIISAHFASEWGKFPTMVDYAFSVYIIAVPFFFCCSGFLFFKKMNLLTEKKDKKAYFIKYEKRIWIMYGCWSLVYFPFQIYIWISENRFNFQTILSYFHSALVIQTFATIWFLPALAIGIAITYFLTEKLSKRTVTIISVLLYILGMFGYTYKFVIDASPIGTIYEWYLILFKTTRNGLFNAVPFIFIGCIVSQKELKPSAKGFWRYAISAGLAFVFMVAESFILKLKFNVSGMDFSVFVVPFTYFFIMAVLEIELKESKIWLWCRKLSLLMFVSQRLFLTCLPVVLPAIFGKIYSNSYIGLIAVISFTLVFAVVMIKMSDKVKFLRKMI